MNPESSAENAQLPQDSQTVAEAVAILAQARAACLERGVPPEHLARMFLDEAILAFLVDGLDDAAIRHELATAMSTRATPWLGKLRQKSGMCDCVAEVHFEAQCEAHFEARIAATVAHGD